MAKHKLYTIIINYEGGCTVTTNVVSVDSSHALDKALKNIEGEVDDEISNIKIGVLNSDILI